MVRLDSMETFVRVAESKSFSAAARRLGISKSVASRQIAALESELGVRLLNRTTRHLALTEIGTAYFERCARILEDVEDAAAALNNLQAQPRGLLHVTAPMSFGVRHLASLIPEFLNRWPEVEIDLVMNDRLVNLIEDGFDLAIRIGVLEDSSLIARQLAPARRMLCASPAYLEAHGTPRIPDDLRDHNCLCYSNLSRFEEWDFHRPDGRRWPVPVKGRLRVNNGDVLLANALAGIGIAMLPTFLAGPDLRAGRLVSLLEDFIQHTSAVFAVYPHGRLLSPKVRALVDFLIERFGPVPYWDRA